MRFRVIAKTPADFEQWLSEQQQGPAQPARATDRRRRRRDRPRSSSSTKYQCTNCHIFDDSSKATYGPNLTHLASRTTFASGTYELNTQEPHRTGS